MNTFNQIDINSFNQRGVTTEIIENQITKFKTGFPFVILEKPATPDDGIVVLPQQSVEELSALFERESKNYSIIKFVPASGAASRMFKNLFTFLETYRGTKEENVLLLHDSDKNSAGYCIQNINKFAFYNDLFERMQKDGLNLTSVIEEDDFTTLVSYILLSKGLNYGSLPKGLLKFHNYIDYSRTAFEEHMAEGAAYACDSKGIVRIHFTISPEHIEPFLELIQLVKPRYSKTLGVNYDITYSIQKPSTDTIAVDIDNNPFRDEKNTLVFRPGGHGALIENLNDLNNDIVFIKNIDNIVPDKIRGTTYLYKKAIGGLLIKLQHKIHTFLRQLDVRCDIELIEEVSRFAKSELFIQFPEEYAKYSLEQKQDCLKLKLNRPIRICGMVKNQGEPGGGPFWLRNLSDSISLQIVESSQVNLNDSSQKNIFSTSTHFNPVDLVCGISNYKGESFDLRNYIDQSTGFISIKSKDGRNLKAQELPGLWNGAMAEWISIFIEVPLITFNPVKTINDLLRDEHQ